MSFFKQFDIGVYSGVLMLLTFSVIESVLIAFIVAFVINMAGRTIGNIIND